MTNRVLKDGVILNIDEIEKEFFVNLPDHLKSFSYDEGRLEGNLCACEGNGKFELLPANDPVVLEGGKRYMKCITCGEGEVNEDGKVIGSCFTFSCPLAPTAEEEDFNNPNIDLNGFSKDDYYEDSFVLVDISK